VAERRSFSRKPRKALSKAEREKLISGLLEDDRAQAAESLTPTSKEVGSEAAKPRSDSFDALDALEASSKQGADLEALDIGADKDGLTTADLPKIENDPAPALQQNAADLSSGGRDTQGGTTENSPGKDDDDGELGKVADISSDHHEIESSAAVEPGPKSKQRTGSPVHDAPSTELPLRDRLRAVYETPPTGEHIEEAVDKWGMLDVIPVDVPHLERNLVITASRKEPAHGAFDVLRTRLVQTLLEHGWKRVAITSPSRNCGKTFAAVNLAISLSRYEASRTVLLDFDMRNPSIADVIGDTRPGKMGDFLRGQIPPEEAFVKFDHNDLNIGPSLAIATNDAVEPYAAELAQDPSTAKSLERMMEELSPDIVLYDMPPALAFDDVIAFRPHFDGVLMVVGGGETRPEDVREVMRRLGEDVPLLGEVLNQAEGEDGSDYSYGY